MRCLPALSWRKREEPGLALGAGTTVALSRVQACLKTLPEGRPPSEQIEALADLIASGTLLDDMPALLNLGEEPS